MVRRKDKALLMRLDPPRRMPCCDEVHSFGTRPSLNPFRHGHVLVDFSAFDDGKFGEWSHDVRAVPANEHGILLWLRNRKMDRTRKRRGYATPIAPGG